VIIAGRMQDDGGIPSDRYKPEHNHKIIAVILQPRRFKVLKEFLYFAGK